MIVCPNTSPLIVLARLDRLELIGDTTSVTLTQAVLDEIHDKRDEVSSRIDAWVSCGAKIADASQQQGVDPLHSLGPGERSVLSFALAARDPVLCLLDDAAAREEARRLGLAFVGTLGLILRAKILGTISRAGPVAREAVDAGLYLDDGVLRSALAEIGETWPPS